MISWLVGESRLPVGSSAMRMAGSLINARAMATLPPLSAGELAGMMVPSISQPQAIQQFESPPCRCRQMPAAPESGNSTFSRCWCGPTG